VQVDSTPGDGQRTKKPSKVPLIALAVVIIVLGATLGYYYIQASSQISSLNSKNSSLQSQLSTEESKYAATQTQLGQDSSQISSLNANVSSMEAKISTDDTQIANDQSQVGALSTKVTSDNASIALLSSQNATDAALISTLRSNVTTFQDDITSLNSQITSLNEQVTKLQATVQNDTSILSLTVAKTEVSSMTVDPNAFTMTYVGSGFAVVSPGYVLITISGTYKTGDVILGINNTLTTIAHSPFSSETIGFGVGSSPYTVLIPVLPGTVTPYIFTNETSITPTVTVMYYS